MEVYTTKTTLCALMTKLVRTRRWLDIHQVLFYVFMDRDEFTYGKRLYQRIVLLLEQSGRSGSQSEQRIRFILSARGASHIIYPIIIWQSESWVNIFLSISQTKKNNCS